MSGYNCRFCNEKLIDTFVDLGITPLSNSFLTQNLLQKKENVFPLHVYVCRNCLLVQLPEFETPENIFIEKLLVEKEKSMAIMVPIIIHNSINENTILDGKWESKNFTNNIFF